MMYMCIMYFVYVSTNMVNKLMKAHHNLFSRAMNPNCVMWTCSIARHVQKHLRLIAVVESLDNGKPIRESRDADVQIVARHLYHHAGWAQLADTEMVDWKPIGIFTAIILLLLLMLSLLLLLLLQMQWLK